MNKTLQWIIGISVIVVTLTFVFSTIWPFVAPNVGWAGYNGYGMMGGAGMMGMANGQAMMNSAGMTGMMGGANMMGNYANCPFAQATPTP